MLNEVGLPAAAAERYPHEFSGGQRQRLGLARALMLRPSLIVADEPVSALDVSIQAQILNLMLDLQRHYGLTYLFISHDLSVVRYMSDTIGVMYLGKLVEVGPAADVYAAPVHPYTRGLIDTVPVADPALERVKEHQGVRGELPSAVAPPSGCRFRTAPRRRPGPVRRRGAPAPPVHGRGPPGGLPFPPPRPRPRPLAGLAALSRPRCACCCYPRKRGLLEDLESSASYSMRNLPASSGMGVAHRGRRMRQKGWPAGSA